MKRITKDENGKIFQVQEFDKNNKLINEKWTGRCRKYKYDDKGILKSYKDSIDYSDYEATVEFDDKGQIISKISIQNNSIIESEYENEYDDKGNCIYTLKTSTNYKISSGNRVCTEPKHIVSERHNEYDDKGNCIYIKYLNNLGDNEYHYEYDENNNLINEINNKAKIKYEYNKNNQLIHKIINNILSGNKVEIFYEYED